MVNRFVLNAISYHGKGAIKEEDLEFLAQSAYADACAPGNPKAAFVEDIKGLIR